MLPANQPRALGGGPLSGDRLLRFAYLDEAGDAKDPFVLAAGVIIDADRQQVALEEHLLQMVAEIVPEEQRPGFYFHAKEIYHGNGFFDRRKPEWSERESRYKILDRLLAIPGAFNLPVVFGPARYPLDFDSKSGTSDVTIKIGRAHGAAFSVAAIVIERWMREHAGSDEIASLIVENNNEAKQHIKEMHALWRSPERMAALGVHPDLPFKRIRGTVHFVLKQEDSLLQLADVCAFTIRRAILQAKERERFFEPLRPQLVLEAI